jgi:DMSO/TMAO reductase YedYZ molybdopterin-dependent catalytic subunit
MMVLVLLTGCASAPPGTPTLPPTTTPRPSLQPGITLTVGNCALQPIVKPTRPAVIPGYAQLDESTGLHMTGDVQNIDLADYQLKVTGKIDHPLTLTYDELRCLPKLTATPALICRGYFEDFAEWSGASLEYLFGLAGVQKEASSVYLVSADGYEAFLTLEEAMREDNFLAYEWEGQPLPIFHGFPVRAVIPSMLGNKWTKWLIEIRVE